MRSSRHVVLFNPQSPGELPPGLKEYGKQVLSVEGNWLSHMDVGGER